MTINNGELKMSSTAIAARSDTVSKLNVTGYATLTSQVTTGTLTISNIEPSRDRSVGSSMLIRGAALGTAKSRNRPRPGLRSRALARDSVRPPPRFTSCRMPSAIRPPPAAELGLVTVGPGTTGVRLITGTGTGGEYTTNVNTPTPSNIMLGTGTGVWNSGYNQLSLTLAGTTGYATQSSSLTISSGTLSLTAEATRQHGRFSLRCQYHQRRQPRIST